MRVISVARALGVFAVLRHIDTDLVRYGGAGLSRGRESGRNDQSPICCTLRDDFPWRCGGSPMKSVLTIC